MENITTDLVSKEDLTNKIEEWFKGFYTINSTSSLQNIKTEVSGFINNLKDNLMFLLEYPYVDKLYRDTFYSYYSSKTIDYSRNCVRVSIFNPSVNDPNLFDTEEIKKAYLGFIVLRPTPPKVIGRNVINPLAFISHDINICSLKINTTANYHKLLASGFPHSTQDGETITCAETTLWSIVEYFSNKYSNYSPLLPSEIHQILSHFSYVRQIPSSGLAAAQLSFALKKIGFGVKIYARQAFTSEFEDILRIYVESGIPVIGVVQNASIGHALNIVGRTSYSKEEYDKIVPIPARPDLNIKNIAKCNTKLVFVDDNYPPYQTAEITSPTSYYSSPIWHSCTITSFIVPLYPKVYMEGGEARKIALDLLTRLNAFKNRTVAIKTFLTSSRSYKDYLLKLTDIDPTLKNLLLCLSMPKFIWVTEIFDEDQFLNNKCEGLIILDATEPKQFHIIGSVFEDNFLKKDTNSGVKALKINTTTFTSYNNNLTYYGDN